MKIHHLVLLALAAILVLVYGGDAGSPAGRTAPALAAPAPPAAPDRPDLTPTPTAEPELAILQYVVNMNTTWMCQGPSGTPGHRQITGCSPYGNFTHPTSGYVDNYGSPGAAQAEWANRRANAQSLYPSFADTSYNGYAGYHANNTAYPYAHYEEYYWGSNWVLGAVSSDDTHFWGGPYVAHAIMDAAATLGYLPLLTPTPTFTPGPTFTPSPTPTGTGCCNGLSASGASACIIGNSYDYGFSVNNTCPTAVTGGRSIYLEVAANLNGPWTIHTGLGPGQQTYPPGSSYINGNFGPQQIPAQYNWWRVRLHIEYGCPPPVDYATAPRAICSPSGSVTPTPGTTTPTRTPIEPPTFTITPTATGTPPTPSPLSFNDVPLGSTFYPFIQWMACRGYVSGYPCGGPGEPCPGSYFRPNNPVTRGQTAKVVANTAQYSETPTGQTFEDVPPGSTFYLWIEQIAGRGIVGGYPCGGPFEPCNPPGNRPYFRPNANVTRGQIAKIVSEARGYIDPVTTQSFEDVPPTNPFYLYIERLFSHGAIAGYPCGGPFEPCIGPGNRAYFRPNNPATRGQLAKIVTWAYGGP